MTNAGGTATAYGYQNKDDGQCTVEVTCDAGYVVDEITATISKGAGTAPTVWAATANREYKFSMGGLVSKNAGGELEITINVTFKKAPSDPYTATAAAGANGTLKLHSDTNSTPGASAAAKEGEKVYVTVTPSEGYVLDTLTYAYKGQTKKIVSRELSANAATYIFLMPNANAVVSATFKPADPAAPQTENANASGKSVGVGAAFALTVSNLSIEAYVGENRVVVAGALELAAIGERKTTTSGVAGSDPLAKSSDGEAKDIALDASVAVSITNATIAATVRPGASVTADGGNLITVLEAQKDAEGNIASPAVTAGFHMHASEVATTIVKASSFAVGKETAVGAAVAVNIATSDVAVRFLGTGTVLGKAILEAKSLSMDDSHALATAMGADLQRYTDKFAKGQEQTEKFANDMSQGKYFSDTGSGDNANNGTAGKINNNLNNNANNEQDGAQPNANNSLPLSANALRSQNASTEDQAKTDTATGTGTSHANDNTDPTVNTNTGAPNASGIGTTPNGTNKQSVQVAAAVAVNITVHGIEALLAGSLTASEVSLAADNSGNFRTVASGAAMSLAQSSNAIAAAVAVSVNRNEARAGVADDSIVTIAGAGGNGGIGVTASLSANTDGDYRGYLGAQALAGAVSGSGGKVSIGGALAVIVSRSVTSASIGGNAHIYNGGDLLVSATDKTKLALRAGGGSISKGAAVGVGASFALIYAHNSVNASIGDSCELYVKSLKLVAEKQRLDSSDYHSAAGLDRLLTDTSELTAAEREQAKTGLIDIHRETDPATGKKSDSYKVEVNITAEKLIGAIDLLNFLSSCNYYVEAIAGSITTGAGSDAKVSVAGSLAMIFFYNAVRALIGGNVQIHCDGNVEIEAASDATVRIIAGSLSASPAKVGVGATVGFLYNEDSVEARTGANSRVTAGGAFRQSASGKANIQLFTAAASISTGSESTASVGGSVNAIAAKNTAVSEIAAGAAIKAASIDIGSSLAMDMMLISLSVSAGNSKVAVGGTVAVIVDEGSALTRIGGNAAITADTGDVNIVSSVSNKLVSALASASGAPQGITVAGVLSVLVALFKARVELADGAGVAADLGGIRIASSAVSWMIVIGLAATGSGSGTVAVGATISVNVFEHESAVEIGRVTLRAGKDITVFATGEDFTVLVNMALGAAGSGNAIAGAIPVVVSNTDISAKVGDGSKLNAGGSIAVAADLSSKTIDVAGGLAAGGGSAGVGATLSTAVYGSAIEARVGRNVVMYAGAAGAGAAGAGVATPNRSDRRRGILISATGNEMLILVAVSAGAAGTAGVAGVVNTLVAKNSVTASVGAGSSLYAGYRENETAPDAPVATGGEGEITLEADDESSIANCAGALAAGGTAGVGATVVVLVFNKTVTADASGARMLRASGGINVTANAKDDLWLLALAFGAGGTAGVAGGVNALVFENKVNAALGGTAVAGKDVNVKASSDSALYNVAAGLGFGGTAGVTAVAVVTYFYNETVAQIVSGSSLTASGALNVLADSKEFVTADAAGVSGGGVAGVGGTIDIVFTKVVTQALTGDGVTIASGGALAVRATDAYTLVAAVVTVAVAGTAAVGVTVLVSLSFNTVTAEIGLNNSIRASAITVEASSNRDILTIVATVAGSGVAGVGVSLSVVVAGGKISKDAHDGIYANDTSLDPQAQTDGAFAAGNSKAISGRKPEDDLGVALAGDDQRVGAEDYNSYGQDTSKQYYVRLASGEDTGAPGVLLGADGQYYRPERSEGELVKRYALSKDGEGRNVFTKADFYVEDGADADGKPKYKLLNEDAVPSISGDVYARRLVENEDGSSSYEYYKLDKATRSEGSDSGMNDAAYDDTADGTAYEGGRITGLADTTSAVVNGGSNSPRRWATLTCAQATPSTPT